MENVEGVNCNFILVHKARFILKRDFLMIQTKRKLLNRLTRKMIARVLTFFFVRHAALVRPLSESEKLRLTRDMAELELVVGQNLFQVEQLGAPYRDLRALKPLFFQ
jgi:hypothetical protein